MGGCKVDLYVFDIKSVKAVTYHQLKLAFKAMKFANFQTMVSWQMLAFLPQIVQHLNYV